MARSRWLVALLCPLTMAACASLTEGTTQTVEVTTTPKSGAKCDLRNEKGSWTVPATPGSTLVVKADGPLLVNCTHPDGDTGTATVKSSTSLGTFGNVLIGGAVGVAVDLSSGAAYIYPNTISVALGSGAPAATSAAAPAPAAEAASGTVPAAALLADTRALPRRVQQAAEFCHTLYQDPRLDPLRNVVALDEAPSLEMQSNAGFLTPAQKAALNAYQPLHDSCRDRLMAANAEVARAFAAPRIGNGEFLSLYQRKTTIGEFNRAQEQDFERLKTALAKLGTPTPAPAAATVPAVYHPAPQTPPQAAAPPAAAPAPEVTRPIDYCQGLIEGACITHLHEASATTR